jgi:hypothetical protein
MPDSPSPQRVFYPVDFAELEVRALTAAMRENNVQIDTSSLVLGGPNGLAPNRVLDLNLNGSTEYTFNATRADFTSGDLHFCQRRWERIYGLDVANGPSMSSVRGPRLNRMGLGLAAMVPTVPEGTVAEFMGSLTGRDLKRPKVYPVREPEPKTRWELLLGEDPFA